MKTTIRGRGKTVKLATFGAGCFWGVEDALRRVPGVVGTAVGYEGGTTKNPTYKEVCTDTTGHAEVVQVEFDPEKTSFDTLLDIFWQIHDPTTRNRQGPDFGSQYRSVVFYHDDAQKAAAVASREKAQASGRYRREIVTEIVPAATFYRAEEYHQQYHDKHGGGCALPH
jgi:peptide-methionine (S)-S-oxide reductase